MQSKEKRKINPRRRLLMHLILAIVVIAILLVLGLRALKPKGAQIVYIAPDENGYDAIWLADLNDPENPRQLTFHGFHISDFQVSQENRVVIYRQYRGTTMPPDYWKLNLNTGNYELIPRCEIVVCLDYELSPSGEWIAYQEYTNELVKVVILNLDTFERETLFEIESEPPHRYEPIPKWVGDSDTIVFRISGSNPVDEFAFYSIEEQDIISRVTLDTSLYTPHFSHNGIFYEYDLSQSESFIRQLRDINNPDLALHLPYPVYDWHPNNEELLMVDYFHNENNTENSSFTDIYLFDMLTGEYDVLLSVENSYPQPTFNDDGSLILYSDYLPDVNFRQLMLFDMETREEITLPIVGRDPQWVNGGR